MTPRPAAAGGTTTRDGRVPTERLDDPPADLLDRVRLLEEVETDLRSQLGALDGR